MYDDIKSYINRNSLNNKITLLQNVNNPFPYYKLSKLFVVSSKYEGFCNVIVEAASFNVPVISSRCNSGPSEILMMGKGGDLFNVGDYNVLSKIIYKRLRFKYKKKVNKLNKTLNRFSVKKNVDEYENIFKKI